MQSQIPIGRHQMQVLQRIAVNEDQASIGAFSIASGLPSRSGTPRASHYEKFGILSMYLAICRYNRPG
jgi:hypothetical protein